MSELNEIQQLESYVGPEKLCVADYSQAQYVFSLGAIREINKAFERLLENRRPSTSRGLSLEELEQMIDGPDMHVVWVKEKGDESTIPAILDANTEGACAVWGMEEDQRFWLRDYAKTWRAYTAPLKEG